MATGIIANLGNSANVSYTPKFDAKVIINFFGNSNGGQLTVNGNQLLQATNMYQTITMYVGANQTLTVATSAYANALVSALEESV